jgi:hypothetical protein
LPNLPPELTQPFHSDAERMSARSLLAQRDRVLRALEQLARKPPDLWSPSELARFPKKTNGVPDPPFVRLPRWASIFADELGEVHRLVVRGALSDLELRQALYLAGRLLATVTDLRPNDVDSFALNDV